MQKEMDYAIQADGVTLHLEPDMEQGSGSETANSTKNRAERISRYAGLMVEKGKAGEGS